ncbi:hypothetical protein CLV46_0840 [Diaminobutyricimonas aerilata]|uniref:Uncharacterized protein n=1 Tax=Diaminobutyricimonas aerilata TaxID=1162967 RepID=A0A2M9CHD5_9MICO|nr:hypothetical protein [Diaminobutyricimonas aerilata]PJJ71297.1 hypothetical protein CLV46_0840 [Diaminobutyricimonas aerilata]
MEVTLRSLLVGGGLTLAGAAVGVLAGSRLRREPTPEPVVPPRFGPGLFNAEDPHSPPTPVLGMPAIRPTQGS